MIYMHDADARQHEIADTLSKLARQELQPSIKASTGRSGGKRSGTQHFLRMVRVRLRIGSLRCVSQGSATSSVRLGAFCRRSPAWPCTQLTA
jgi:hypothetical protein